MDQQPQGRVARPGLSTIAAEWLRVGQPFMLVSVAETAGSTPREQGAMMLVSAEHLAGTIGGGRLEWDAILAARDMLCLGEALRTIDITLGPAIGQCCGGRVTLLLKQADDRSVATLAASEAAQSEVRPAVLIYGAGHVGRALAAALAPLPFQVQLIDSRTDELQRANAPGVMLVQSDALASLAERAADGAAHVVMTHSHALDSLIAAAVLEQNRFSYLGLIGSRTKRNSFRRAFREMGIAADRINRVICPIGGTAVRDKRPEVIAALVCAEITTALLRAD